MRLELTFRSCVTPVNFKLSQASQEEREKMIRERDAQELLRAVGLIPAAILAGALVEASDSC